jgi:tRNA(Arg) A34 adenosine deaminase TadA
MATEQDRQFMLEAIRLARRVGCVDKTGGPFGCVIAKDGRLVATGGNRVLADKDPTAHGEITAIRNACHALDTHDLSGYTLYTSCMCCPMCYAASYWARIDKIFYAARCEDYVDDFDDVAIYGEFSIPLAGRTLKPEEVCRDEMLALWGEWRRIPDRARY